MSLQEIGDSINIAGQAQLGKEIIKVVYGFVHESLSSGQLVC
jgi:hypothetical protein